jgi:hypothetical protein
MDKAKSKTQDRPHLITIALAVSAFIVSVASFSYAYKAYELNRVVNTAAVDINNVVLRDSWKWAPADRPDQNQLPLSFNVENLGKMTAKEISVQFNLAGVVNGINPSTRQPIWRSTGTTLPLPLLPDDLVPGEKRYFELRVPTDQLSLALKQLPDFGDNLSQIVITIDIGFSDQYSSQHRTLCFNRRTDNGEFKEGPISSCNTVARGSIKVTGGKR